VIRVIHDLIPKQVRLHGINIHNAKACVQDNNIYTLLYTLTTCTATSELWQWTRHRIDTVLCTDPGYMPPQWLVLPDITLRPKIKRPGKIWLRTYTIVVRNGSSVTLRDYMDFLRRACNTTEEIRKNDHISGAYLEKCTWGDTYSLRYPVSLNSLEHRNLGCPMAMCCKQMDSNGLYV
jgi:hypothetical protein